MIRPIQWQIEIFPEQSDLNNNELNHVGCKLGVTVPANDPETSLPVLEIEIIKGLADHHVEDLQQLAKEKVVATSSGMARQINPSVGMDRLYGILYCTSYCTTYTAHTASFWFIVAPV
jgi:hypothetical protein